TEQTLDKPNVVFQPDHDLLIAAVAGTNATPKQTSALGGIHAGYAWRVGYLLPRLEADLGYWGYKNTAQEEQTFQGLVTARTVRSTNTAQGDYIATVRPRVGFNVSERAIVNFNAGVAFSNLKHSNLTEIDAETPPGGTVTYQSSKKANVGW